MTDGALLTQLQSMEETISDLAPEPLEPEHATAAPYRRVSAHEIESTRSESAFRQFSIAVSSYRPVAMASLEWSSVEARLEIKTLYAVGASPRLELSLLTREAARLRATFEDPQRWAPGVRSLRYLQSFVRPTSATHRLFVHEFDCLADEPLSSASPPPANP